MPATRIAVECINNMALVLGGNYEKANFYIVGGVFDVNCFNRWTEDHN
jgi:hypothetical protein